jgi:hypothetical protein
VPGIPEWLLWTWLGAGPATFYSLARVLRPEPRSQERTPRHLLAAAAAIAVPTVACTFSRGEDASLEVFLVFGPPAAAFGPAHAGLGPRGVAGQVRSAQGNAPLGHS